MDAGKQNSISRDKRPQCVNTQVPLLPEIVSVILNVVNRFAEDDLIASEIWEKPCLTL